ncbi:hypothetical protein F2P81_020279 [Scophthalmus maximus]|uniref:Uncharacterized protein n=1 Tax=Scophthalmus maximus TaxID=52904 RepID=A0A6A4S5Q8_SCOMX|nr:hypothetical protein F2P81_020279 [Scophthalmus maximus]
MPASSGNYRPKSHDTTHICKLMERVINENLMYFLEKHRNIWRAAHQSGFRERTEHYGSMCRVRSWKYGNKERDWLQCFDVGESL